MWRYNPKNRTHIEFIDNMFLLTMSDKLFLLHSFSWVLDVPSLHLCPKSEVRVAGVRKTIDGDRCW